MEGVTTVSIYPTKSCRSVNLEPVQVTAPLVEGNGLFGIGCTIGPEGCEIRIGDEVEVTSRIDPVLFAPL